MNKPKFKIGQKISNEESNALGLWDYVKEVHTIQYKKDGKIKTRIEYACGVGRCRYKWEIYSESELMLFDKTKTRYHRSK